MNRAFTLLLVACLSLSTITLGVAADSSEDIPTNAAGTGAHDSLVSALDHVNLTTTLAGEGPFTVFAPTDQAFADAGIDLSTYDTDEENQTLRDILLYHVLDGAVESANVTDGLVATMLNGDNTTFAVDNESVAINDANVTTADVMASNGIIHVIDKVLFPPAEETNETEEESEPEAVDPFDGVDCAATVGIADSGLAFTPTVVNIAVGETVCWHWEDASMPHNVKQVDGFKSTTYVDNGITSGDASSTVAFSYTFTEDTTFYYACEPHILSNMFGEVVVGDGGSSDSTADTSEPAEDTPGFLVVSTVLAIIGALALMGRQGRDD